MFRKLTLLAATASFGVAALASSAAIAQRAPAPTPAVSRAAAASQDDSELNGSSAILAILALLALAAGIATVIEGDGDPVSP